MEDEWSGQTLHQFAMYDRYDALTDILQGTEKANINAPDRFGRTPVFTAVSNNSIQCLEILLKHGADPSMAATDWERLSNMTPLHQAVLDAKTEAIKLLLEHGADLTKPDKSGLSPMALVKRDGPPEHISMFEQEDELRKQKAMELVSDLCAACEADDLEKVKDILSVPSPAGWDLASRSLQNKPDISALFIAAEKGNLGIMVELLGSVRELPQFPAVMHAAVQVGHVDIVRHIIEKFPESARYIDLNSQTPLHVACEHGHLDIVVTLMAYNYPDELLKEWGDDQVHYKHALQLNHEDDKKRTPFYVACENGRNEIVDYMLSYKVIAHKFIDLVDDQFSRSQSSTPSSNPVSTDRPNTVEYNPINVQSEKPKSSTPRSADSSSVLYKRVPNREQFRKSCVLAAVKNGHLGVLNLLIKQGASLDLYDVTRDGQYSVLLKEALDSENLFMLVQLLDNGAVDVNNYVFEEAVRSKPKFISYFLKYKVSEDKNNSINRASMKEVYSDISSVSSECIEELPTNDSKYMQIFPKEAVHIRWQNLKVLSTVERSWLITATNHINRSLNNLNDKIPLFGITRVDLSGNSLTIVPTALLQLPSVATLTLSKNKITEFPSQRNFDLHCDWLEHLVIDHNQLTAIPEYIFTLPKLKTLNASNNLICKLPPSMWEAISLRTLKLNKNKIEMLPKPVFLNARTASEASQDDSDMTNSQDQLMSSLENRTVFHSVTRATHWSQKLVVHDDDGKNSKKKGIQNLKLSDNSIKEFPDFLSCCCPNMESLELMNNRLSSMGNLAAYPKSLKTLELGFNQIQTMEDWKVEDTAKKCYCSGKTGDHYGKHHVCMHRGHTRLESLESLDLSGNHLKQLVVLRKEVCTLTLSQSLGKSVSGKEDKERQVQLQVLLPSLTRLHLDRNRLTDLTPDIKEMKALRVLTLKQNGELKELPPALGLLDGLQRIELQMCPIEGPIQDVIKGATNRASDITGFLRAVLEEAVEYNSMNLMIVGSFNIGKTSLMKHLMKKGKTVPNHKGFTHYVQRQDVSAKAELADGKPLSTVGIDISQLVLDGKKGTVDFRTWDFAGQKEYYATHQYFLSPRSLYLVVWNLTDGFKGIENLKQWLVNIQAQAKGSAVIIVGTHLDKVKDGNTFPKDWEKSMVDALSKKYQCRDYANSGLPHVIDIINVAAGKKPAKIELLKNKIYEHVFKLKHPARPKEMLLGHKIPRKYLHLQECIAHIAQERMNDGKEPVLYADHYQLEVMREVSKGEEEIEFRNNDDLNHATRFLHENGVICHFEDTSLKGQYFLEPQWLCDQLAKVVSIKEVQKYANKGVMKKADLDKVYKNSTHISKYILNLLNKFEVALAIDEDYLILPTLLPTHVDIRNPSEMKKIPIRRKGVPLSTTVSVDGFGSQSSLEEGEMTIHSTTSDVKAVFANTRLYILTYFPSGFWPRLITRILADESFYEPVINLFKIPNEIYDRCPAIQNSVPSWRCWQTGFELVYLDTVIMQVKEVHSDTFYGKGMCNYGDDGLVLECFFDNNWGTLDVTDSVILEISFKADKITFNFGINGLTASLAAGSQNFQSIEQKDIYHDEKMQTGILAKIVEHIDNLLQDWFPDLGESRFNQTFLGRYLVTRVIPCPFCLQAEINKQNNAAEAWDCIHGDGDKSQPLSMRDIYVRVDTETEDTDDHEQTASDRKRVMCTFLVEKCIKNVLEGMDEICKLHKAVSPVLMPGEDGFMRQIFIAPDAVFHDLDVSLLVEDDALEKTEKLGHGAFGTVYAGKLKQDELHTSEVAMKVLYDPKDPDRRRPQQSTQISLETICSAYTNARQEVTILQTVEHPHIVPLLGLSRRPLALILSRAPLGSLKTILQSREKEGVRLPVWVIKQTVIQVTDALAYLHKQNIIYRDLKSDNVLAWHFPPANELSPRSPVTVKLADYGISKPVFPGGEAKGYGGTPPFIAPEIIIHTGRDTYTEKVDMFSFGMFMFELLTCRAPLEDVNNITVHVAHGGRPTLKTEEAVYPSHMLDIMTVCWDHEPQSRPSATHVRTIATTPQFCHLMDTVTMETQSSVLAATSVFVESLNFHVKGERVDHSQVWMLSHPEHDRNKYEVNILSYDTNNKCIGNKELKHQLELMSLCNVEGNIWCLDEIGKIHIFDSVTLEMLDRSLQLEVNRIEQLLSMSYHPETGGHLVILLKSPWEMASLLFVIHAADGIVLSHDMIQPIKIYRQCWCAATVQSGTGCKVWVGAGCGQILVRDIDHLDNESLETELCPVPTSMEHHLCRFIATPVGMALSDCHRIWTYTHPGSKVYSWDADSQELTGELDCSSIIPGVERYTASRSDKFKANRFQVTALLAFEGHLYTSTTWGCVIVADAFTMKALSVFRCHGHEEFYCKAILPIGPHCHGNLRSRNSVADDNNWSAHSADGHSNHSSSHHSISDTGSNTSSTNVKSSEHSGVVTIGRGYVDIIRQIASLDKQVLVSNDTADGWSVVDTASAPTADQDVDRAGNCNTFVLSWDPQHWNFY